MTNAELQDFARYLSGNAGMLGEDLQALATAVGVPEGQLMERLGEMMALPPATAWAVLQQTEVDQAAQLLGVGYVLRKYGSDAHLYLPGVGVIDGFTAGNYQLSTGTAGVVDQPVGLVLDAEGSVGSELLTNGDFGNGSTAWTLTPPGADYGASVSSGSCRIWTNASNTYAGATQNLGSNTTGRTFMYSVRVVSVASGSVVAAIGAVSGPSMSAPGTYTGFIAATSNGAFEVKRGGVNSDVVVDDISVKEVTGIHASQTVAGYKPMLRQSGGKYSWQFDGADDRLALGGVPFQAADDFTIIAGVAPSSDSVVYRRIFGASGTTALLDLLFNTVTGYASLRLKDDAGVEQYAGSSTPNLFGAAHVVSAVKRANVKQIRVDGLLNGSNPGATGPGAFTSAFIGASGAGASPFKGNMDLTVLIKGTVSDNNLKVLEKWVGKLSGVTIA